MQEEWDEQNASKNCMNDTRQSKRSLLPIKKYLCNFTLMSFGLFFTNEYMHDPYLIIVFQSVQVNELMYIYS